jgi:NAD(P)-dependent dehydrogenase (short-subunit alcohol dehydrogenase family)
MSNELENKVALITGGTTGIGRDTAVLFAKEGAKVVFSGRREVEGNETLNLVRAGGGDGHFIKSDASKSADVESLVQKTIEKYGRLDVAFNNAGIEASGPRSPSKLRKIGTKCKTSISKASGSA